MVKVNSKSQNGRSMVEMLGVLAIVGVLSVGGVYGYGVAMKKHKANELLHQASMLATDISTKILTGKPLGNITDFGSTANGTFSETVGTPNDEQFTLQITDVDESVCKQLQSMNGGMVRQVECGTVDGNGKTTATLKFNNNLSSEPVAGDNDGNQEKCEDAGNKYCSGSGACVSEGKDCCAGYDLQCCDSETGNISSMESCTTKDGKEGTCLNGKCELSAKNCTDKECCDSLGGDWAEDNSSGKSICCSESDGKALCSFYDGDCRCCPSGISDYFNNQCLVEVSASCREECHVSNVVVAEFKEQDFCMGGVYSICKDCHVVGGPGSYSCASTKEEAIDACGDIAYGTEWDCYDADFDGDNYYDCVCKQKPFSYDGNKSGCEEAGYKYCTCSSTCVSSDVDCFASGPSQCDGNQIGCEEAGYKYCLSTGTCVSKNTNCTCSGLAECYQSCNTETGAFEFDIYKIGEECTIDGVTGTCDWGGCILPKDCIDVYGPGSQDCVKSLEEASAWCIEELGGWGCTGAEEYSDGTYGCIC